MIVYLDEEYRLSSVEKWNIVLLEVNSLSKFMPRNVRKRKTITSEIVMHMGRAFFPAAKD